MEEKNDLTKLLTGAISRIETNKIINEGSSNEMRRTMVLVENKKDGDTIYNKIKKEFIDLDFKKRIKDSDEFDDKEIENLKNIHEKNKKHLESQIKEEDKKYKEVLKKSVSEYGMSEDVITQIFKIVKEKNYMTPEKMDKAMLACKILNIRNLEEFKNNQETLELLLF